MSRCEAHRPEAPGEERPGQFPVGPGAIRAAGLRHPGPNQRAPRADQNSAAGRGEFLGHGRGPARPPAVGRAPGHGGQLDRPDGRVGREERERSIELGRYVEACDSCAARPWCHGMRDDYLRVHGEGELGAVTAGQLALGNPRGSLLDIDDQR